MCVYMCMYVHTDRFSGRVLYDTFPMSEYFKDLNSLLHLIAHGPTKSVCYRRLQLLDAKFSTHLLLNGEAEKRTQKVLVASIYTHHALNHHRTHPTHPTHLCTIVKASH